ncbi:ribosome small subunit-dependent GTPase A [Neochlamydia sp. S13]|uniref:ribosome small subunit-dependent GTPase A n=1 Tax=Neochlamydia sp. S13 TaxID=1353976 RepID=UPI000A84CED5|nr:ribosome small subunit-dependent GTPase A [Neochlamydia sp. S13]BBI17758.1 ribosome biogenesis GTPase RsgA [Neochlamydia sp. S13]
MKNSKQDDLPRMPKKWVGCDLEADYFKDDRKNSRKERKLASAKDRSKYKKTDRDKRQKNKELHQNIKLAKEDLLRGRVLSITPQGIMVEHEDAIYACSMRGLLKKEKTQFKNLVTVGDLVLFQRTDAQEGLIAHVEERYSVLSRADNLSRRQEQLIAANIDQVLITVSVVNPPLKPFLVDRYIIAARKGGMEPVIVVNKIDLLDHPTTPATEKELYKDFLHAYKAAQIHVIPVSIVNEQGLDQLKSIMKNKASVFSGQSGVGKSSLINAITGLNFKVGKVVEKTKKGSHTTTTAKLIPLEFGGWCIDTPGIKSFGLWDLNKEEVEQYFPEIEEIGQQCKFPNCSHTHEKECAVHAAVENEKLSPLRFASYQYLLEALSQEHLRR